MTNSGDNHRSQKAPRQLRFPLWYVKSRSERDFTYQNEEGYAQVSPVRRS